MAAEGHEKHILHLSTMAVSPSTTTGSSGSNSPALTRDSSPSPSISPTPALFACPPLSRSFSANSSSAYSTLSGSTVSQASVTSRSSSASAAIRQRGYVRPQGVSFAPSAGNRDSVLSLGSIAHLQYYFARTGLLDGKGGQLAKEDKTKSIKALPRIFDNPEVCQSPTTESQDVDPLDPLTTQDEPLMLPPTVSTYSHKVQYIPPPPDLSTLRQDLKITLSDAKKALEEVQERAVREGNGGGLDQGSDCLHKNIDGHESISSAQTPGWFEIEGVHILDVVTLAIRAAKIYYTSHDEPQRLYSIKSERQLRQDLYAVLDVLKKMASRTFAGGMKEDELRAIRQWLISIEEVLSKEEAMEKQEKLTRESWHWLSGSWEGKERERERQFLCSFLLEGELPEWKPVDPANPNEVPFLEFLRTGVALVQLHNALLKKSKRQFGDIKTYHTDTTKPYRCAENLRYWIKAAEIRWEVKLKVNVTAVVNQKPEAWPEFDAAVLQWSRAVREELTREWTTPAHGNLQTTPNSADMAKEWSEAANSALATTNQPEVHDKADPSQYGS